MYLILALFISLIILFPQKVGLSLPVSLEDLIIIIFLFTFLIKHKFKLKTDKIFKKIVFSFVLFIIVNFLSLGYAVIEGYQGSIRDVNTIFLYIKSLIFLLGGYLIRDSLKKINNNTIIFIFCAAIFVSSLLAIVQYYDIAGLRDAAYFLYDDGSYKISRAIGAIGNPNYAAYYHGLAFLLLLTYETNSIKTVMVKVFLISILLTSVVITYSRTGILALLISWAIFLLINKKYKNLLIGLVIGLVIVVYYIDDLVEGTRFGIILAGEGGGTVTNFGNRSDAIWSSKFDKFFANPLIGSGPQKEALSDTAFNTTLYDNSYLLLLVTSGLIGFIAYFYIFYKIIYYDIFKLESNKYKGILTTICLYTMLFYLTVDLVWNVKFISYFYILIGFYMRHIVSETKLGTRKLKYRF